MKKPTKNETSGVFRNKWIIAALLSFFILALNPVFNLKAHAAATPYLGNSSISIGYKSYNGGNPIYNCSSPVSVSVVSGSSWLSASIPLPAGVTQFSSSTGAFVFIVKENTSSSSRTGKIRVNVNGTILNCTINQAGKTAPFLRCDSPNLSTGSAYTFSYFTKSCTLRFISNRDISVKLNYQPITMTKSKLGTDVYQYTYTINMGEPSRTGKTYDINVAMTNENAPGGKTYYNYVIRRAAIPKLSYTLSWWDMTHQIDSGKVHSENWVTNAYCPVPFLLQVGLKKVSKSYRVLESYWDFDMNSRVIDTAHPVYTGQSGDGSFEYLPSTKLRNYICKRSTTVTLYIVAEETYQKMRKGLIKYAECRDYINDSYDTATLLEIITTHDPNAKCNLQGGSPSPTDDGVTLVIEGDFWYVID